MSEKEQIEYLMIRLQRTDAWINSSDTKTSIILATLGVLLAILINEITFTVIENVLNYSIIFRIFNIIIIYIGAYYSFEGVRFLFKALTPKLDNLDELPPISSLHYFGDISDLTNKRFNSEYKKRTSEDDIDDLLSQIHINSKICIKKHNNLNAGIYNSTRGFFVLYITIIFNYLLSLCIM